MILMWVLAVVLWIVAAAFAVSDLAVIAALFHYRNDREMALICAIVMVAMTAVTVGIVVGALAVGRQLI